MQRLLRLGLVSVVALQLGASQPGSVYDFSLNRIDGSKESLSTYRGKKFLVGRDGQIVERISPQTQPLDPGLVERIQKLLATKPVSQPGG